MRSVTVLAAVFVAVMVSCSMGDSFLYGRSCCRQSGSPRAKSRGYLRRLQAAGYRRSKIAPAEKRFDSRMLLM